MLFNSANAISADDAMTTSWQPATLFESKQYALTTSITANGDESSIIHKVTKKQNYDAGSLQIPGLGMINNGVYDVTDATHVIFYTDGVVIKLDY